MDTEQTKKELDSRIDHFASELAKIRSGRAHASIIEDVIVDYYGTKTPIRGLGSIRMLDPQTLVVEPWDKNALEPIAGAISRSSMGLQAIVSENYVRVPFPPLSEERRAEFVKHVGRKAEEARVQIRQIRDDTMKRLQAQEKAGEISEDEKFRTKEQLEKTFKEYADKIESLKEQKEKELSQI